MTRYDANYIAQFFDTYGEQEWERLERNPEQEVSLHIHKHYLSKYVRRGQQVLEAGAGPGRFTIELARLGAQVVVGDISAGQLALNKHYVTEAGYESQIASRHIMDITRMVDFTDNQFDVVVCYGGPVSYTIDQGETAIRELLRVVKPGGFLLLSVMSLIGATRMGYPAITDLPDYPAVVSQVLKDGILSSHLTNGQPMKLYRASELQGLLEHADSRVVAASACNCLTLPRDGLMRTERQSAHWEQILAWELDICAEPGNLDTGSHILMVAQKRDDLPERTP